MNKYIQTSILFLTQERLKRIMFFLMVIYLSILILKGCGIDTTPFQHTKREY